MEPSLEAKVDSLVPSRVAALVKQTPGGLKVRLIHDLRRSGVNATASIPERVVLPRLIDAVESIVKVATADQARQGVDLAVLDFADAFKQLPVHLSEQRFLSDNMSRGGAEGWFHYRTVLFGASAGPLGSCGRIAHAHHCVVDQGFANNSAGSVDDPLLGFRSTQEACDEMFAGALPPSEFEAQHTPKQQVSGHGSVGDHQTLGRVRDTNHQIIFADVVGNCVVEANCRRGRRLGGSSEDPITFAMAQSVRVG